MDFMYDQKHHHIFFTTWPFQPYPKKTYTTSEHAVYEGKGSFYEGLGKATETSFCDAEET